MQLDRASDIFSIDNIKAGYELSKRMNISISHHEYPDRNEKLGCVLSAAHEAMSGDELDQLIALHDNDGWLCARLSPDSDSIRWTLSLGQIWGDCFEDPNNILVFVENENDVGANWVDEEHPMYEGTRYDLTIGEGNVKKENI